MLVRILAGGLALLVISGCSTVAPPPTAPGIDLIGTWHVVTLDADTVPEEWVPSVERWEFHADGRVVVATPVNDGDGRYTIDGSTVHFSDVKISAVGGDPVESAVESAMAPLVFAETVDVTPVAPDRIALSAGGVSATLERRTPVAPHGMMPRPAA